MSIKSNFIKRECGPILAADVYDMADRPPLQVAVSIESIRTPLHLASCQTADAALNSPRKGCLR
jgi:hypothetical protein